MQISVKTKYGLNHIFLQSFILHTRTKSLPCTGIISLVKPWEYLSMFAPTAICIYEVILWLVIYLSSHVRLFSRTKNKSFYFISPVPTDWMADCQLHEWLKQNQKCLTSTWIAYNLEWSLPSLCAWPWVLFCHMLSKTD